MSKAPAPRVKLTALAVKNLEGSTIRREIPDQVIVGLYLIVQPSGAKSWAVRYRFGNRPRKLTLGAYPAFDLKEAREAARDALRAVEEGRDPSAEKVRGEAARSDDANKMPAVFAEFVKRHAAVKNRERTVEGIERSFDNELREKWKHRLVASITKREIVDLLDGMVDSGRPIAANRLHSLLRKFFNWAIERDILHASPMATVKAPSQETTRDRVLTDDEIRLVWKASNKIGWPFGPMFKLLLLTGQRREEVSAASRAEFNLTSNQPMWIIPKERAKNKKGHAVPLVPAAVEIVDALPVIEGEAKLLLTTTGETPISGFSKAKASLDAEMRAIAVKEAAEHGLNPESVKIHPWRIHDLRRTAATGMAALGFPVHVVEAVLNHKSGSIKGVAAVYNRHDC